MVDPSLSDLLKEKSKEAFFDELVDAAIEEKIPETAWQSGEPLRAVMSIVARVLATLWALALPWLRAPFLDYAEGPWLTLVAWSFYGVKRKGAEFGRRDLVIENAGPGSYVGGSAIVPGQIRIWNTVTGKTFTNVTGGSLAAWIGSGPKPTVTLTFQADEAGTGSDTYPGDIDYQPITAPSGVLVNAASAAAATFLGSDEESDDLLRARCKRSQAPLSPAGPKAAYEMIAMSTLRPDGNPVAVNRVRVVDTGSCSVEVWLASPSGPTTGDMATPGSDVFLVYQALLKSVVPTGITCNVYGAQTQSLATNITLIVDIDSGLTKEEAEDAATASIASWLAKFPIGGYRETPAGDAFESGKLFASELAAKASEAAEGIVRATVDLGDIDPTILYNTIPELAFDVTAQMVKQQ